MTTETEKVTEATVLDKGYVHLVEHMGGDRAVVQAARVSYRSSGLDDPERDRRLVKYLWDHQHGTPFEQAWFKFHVKCPIFVMRQWVRHRMGSFNEVSGRYTKLTDDFYVPETWRAQDTVNKQGSVEAPNLQHAFLSKLLVDHHLQSFNLYNRMITDGVAKEMARFVLPVTLYTEFYWSVNARSLINFLSLRCEAHAQQETRQYANAIWPMFRGAMPWTAEAVSASWDPARYEVTRG